MKDYSEIKIVNDHNLAAVLSQSLCHALVS